MAARVEALPLLLMAGAWCQPDADNCSHAEVHQTKVRETTAIKMVVLLVRKQIRN